MPRKISVVALDDARFGILSGRYGTLIQRVPVGICIVSSPSQSRRRPLGAQVVLARAAFAWVLVVAVMAAFGGKVLVGTVSAFVRLAQPIETKKGFWLRGGGFEPPTFGL